MRCCWKKLTPIQSLYCRGLEGEARAGSVVSGCLALVGFLLIGAGSGIAAEKTQAKSTATNPESGVEFFEKSIRPILVERCYKCHSEESGKRKGGLLLDRREGWHVGGDTGPAIVPGNVDESLVIEAVRYSNPDFEMPPKGKLSAGEIALLERWVKMGTPDPRVGGSSLKPAKRGIDVEKGRRFWSFRPVVKAAVPATRDGSWAYNDIDRFILAQLEQEKLKPVADAGRADWIRRVYFDLIGLPPTPEQIDAFVEDGEAEAYAKVVDRLLASEHFGERWGRHWLDVARFAESSGGGRTLLYPDAWRYRDYVISSFAGDKPYDQFVREQIAGDLLPHASLAEKTEHLTATAYLTLGPTNYERQDKAVLETDVVDEQLDSIGKGILGMTFGCARCHDHKFDPISTKDYYAMAGILMSTQTLVHSNVSRWVETPMPLPAEEEARYARQEALVASLETRVAGLKRELNKVAPLKPVAVRDLPGIVVDDSEAVKVGNELASRDGQKQLGGELKKAEAELKAEKKKLERPLLMSVREGEKIGDFFINIRGILGNRGPDVPRGFPEVATTKNSPVIPAGYDKSGRLEFAQWLSSAENPLMARVMVNRIWYWVYGRGLVSTLDNFGTTGEKPSHPELLDYLAADFVENGWSVKKLVRDMVLSHTYRLSVATDERGLKSDPGNRLRWRMNRRRLDAESIRDAVLVSSGKIDLEFGGVNIKMGTTSEYGYEFADDRRSVYTPVFRNQLLELFEAFDFANPNQVSGGRPSSTIATQALYFMNHPFVIEKSREAAKRLLQMEGLSEPDRIDLAYRESLGRLPGGRERELAAAFVSRSPGSPEERLERWAQFYQTLFGCLDFRYLN